MSGVTHENADFYNSPLNVDPASVRLVPWEKPGDDLLVLSNYTDETAALCPHALLQSVLGKGADRGLTLKHGLELEYTLFTETSVSLAE